MLVLQSAVHIASRLTTFKNKRVKINWIVTFVFLNVCISFHSLTTNKVRQHDTEPFDPNNLINKVFNF